MTALKFTVRTPCQLDPDRWFSDSDRGATVTPEQRLAVAACRTCPVQEACLTWALDHPDLAAWGIWGGTTPTERAALRPSTRPRRRAPHCGTVGGYAEHKRRHSMVCSECMWAQIRADHR